MRAKALARTLCTGASELAAAEHSGPSGALLGAEGLAAVSHKVRIPLAVVLSAAELFCAKLKKENGGVFRTECAPCFLSGTQTEPYPCTLRRVWQRQPL